MWTCVTKHSQCSPTSISGRKKQLPRRLIEISGGNTVRLLDTEKIGDNHASDYAHAVEYLALSHCWGSTGPRIRLTSKTASMLYEDVDITTLAKSFQDAIAVTRKFWDEFGVRYLWIDSLCMASCLFICCRIRYLRWGIHLAMTMNEV